MTDGIIQKVFREYLEHNVVIFHAEFYNKATKKILFEIQQELIKYIKKNSVWQSNLELHMISQEALIDDTE